MPRTMRLTSGTERGDTLMLRTPSPISANAMSGCDAISPHTVTSMPFCCADLHRALNQPQHGRVQRREARRQIRVAAIDGERVLHEIVRADAEERRRRSTKRVARRRRRRASRS